MKYLINEIYADTCYSKEKELIENLREIKKLENYDGDKFIYSLYHLTSQILYFYKVLAKGGESSKVVYHKTLENYEHRLIYINLGRGFPKELCDGHWCYVVKDMGNKLMVIPSTSIKKDSHFNEDYHLMVASEDNHKKQYISRLSLSDIRSVDIQRIDLRKDVWNVITDRAYILAHIKSKLF